MLGLMNGLMEVNSVESLVVWSGFPMAGLLVDSTVSSKASLLADSLLDQTLIAVDDGRVESVGVDVGLRSWFW